MSEEQRTIKRLRDRQEFIIQLALSELCPACAMNDPGPVEERCGEWVHPQRGGSLYHCRAGRFRKAMAD